MHTFLLVIICIACLTLSSCTFTEESVFYSDNPTASSTVPQNEEVISIPMKRPTDAGVWCKYIQENEDGLAVGSGISALLDTYFSYRCDTFARAEGITLSSLATLSVSQSVKIQEDTERLQGLIRLRNLWNCHFSGAQVLYTVEKMEFEGATAVLWVYEAAYFYHWYEGISSPASSDISGYGIRHIIRVRDNCIVSDHYNEGRPTEVAVESRLTDKSYQQYAGTEHDVSTDTYDTTSVTVDDRTNAFPSLYQPYFAKAYADAWALSRNLHTYTDLHIWGGDCANFTSQCLFYGGMPMQGNWYWQDNKGGRAWKAATWLYIHLTQEFPTGRALAVILPTDTAGQTAQYKGETVKASTLFIVGSPVFYRWDGGFAVDGEWSHAAVCVGVHADGSPSISCHSEDRYQFKWNYGDEHCQYGTVQLTSVQ